MQLSVWCVFPALLFALVSGQTTANLAKYKKPKALMRMRPPTLPKPAISGGKVSNLILSPYMAAITIQDAKGDIYFCGGSLIYTSWVLTAAHCVDIGDKFTVRLGSLNPNTGGQLFSTTQKFKHPAYDSSNVNNDIALLKLPTPAILKDGLNTINLMPRNIRCFTHMKQFKVFGWGFKSEAEPYLSDVLIFTTVNETTDLECMKQFPPAIVPPTVVCAVGTLNENTCGGDSGGPLVFSTGMTHFVAGIISFGQSGGCGSGGPAGYTEVAPYLDWIQLITDIVNNGKIFY